MSTNNDSHAWHGLLDQSASQHRNVDVDVNLPKDDTLNIHVHTNTGQGEDQSNTEGLAAHTIEIGLTRTESPLPFHPLGNDPLPMSSPIIGTRGDTQNSDAFSEYEPKTQANIPERVPTPERRRSSTSERRRSASPSSPANFHPSEPSHHSRSSRTRSRRSERSPSYPPVTRGDAPNPYSGMGQYMTPQYYASPLPIPSMMPPADYGYTNPLVQTPRSHLQSLPPPPPSNVPTSTWGSGWGSGWGQPSFQPQSTSMSANIVAAAATPEWKGTTPIADLKTMTEAGSFAENNPYRRRSNSRKSTLEHSNGGSFPSSPYYSTAEARPTSQHSPWPQYPLNGAQWRAPSASHSTQRPSSSYQPDKIGSPYYDTSPNYNDPWPSGYQRYPGVPVGGYSPPRDRWESHSARTSALPNYSQYGNSSSRLPSRSESGPQRRMTSADVVSAAASAPTSEKARKQRANSFLTSDPYPSYPSSNSAHRRNTPSPTRPETRTAEWASHNPYRLPTPSRKGSTAPGSGWGSSWDPTEAHWPIDEPSRHRRSSRRQSYAESDYDGYNDYDYDRRTSDRYRRGSSHRRRSQSPDYSRRRRRRHSISPQYYQPPYMYPGYGPPIIPYGAGPGSNSYDTVGSVMKHHLASSRPHSLYRRPGFWNRVGSFFKSPFEGGRPTITSSPRGANKQTGVLFFVEVIIGQIYFHILLRLPSLYFSRVSRIFDESNLNLVEITEMVFQTAGGADNQNKQNAAVIALHAPSPFVKPEIRPQYERLKSSWEAFIDSLIREWETFNIVSVMLLTAILTILQINTAAGDPVTRYTALFSLICSMVSLLFGCMYIIRFGTMRKTYAAAEWAKSAINASQSDLWNVWVLLSMPVVWLAWSILLFIASIMSFVWRTTANDDDTSTLILSARTTLVIRVIMSALLGLGLVNTVLITNTFRRYGEALDEDWKIWIKEWNEAKAVETHNPNMIDYGPLPGSMPPIIPEYPGFFTSSQTVPPSKPDLPSSPNTPYIPPLSSPPGSPWNNVNVPVQSSSTFPVKSALKKPRSAPNSAGTPGPIYGPYISPDIYMPSESDSTMSSSSDGYRSRRRRRQYSRSSSRSSPDSTHHSSGRTNDRRPRRGHRNRRSSTQSSQPSMAIPPPVVAISSPISRPANNLVQHLDRQGDGSYQAPYSPTDGNETNAYDEGNRVRFRSPLESAREATNSGGSEWGAYDSSFDNPNSPRVIGPSSSSASGLTALSESSNVHIQNSDALRHRRRPP